MRSGTATAALIYAGGALIAKAAKFVLIPIYVASLSGTDVGSVYFLEAVITVAARFFSLGLGAAARRLPADFAAPEQGRVYVKTLWFAGLAASAALYLATAMVAFNLPEAWELQVPREWLLYALGSGALRSAIHIPQGYQVLVRQAGRHELINIFDLVLSSVLVMIAVGPLDLGVMGYLHAQAAGAIAVIVACYGLVGRVTGISFARIGESFRYALPGLPHFMFGWGLTFADRFVVERFTTLKELGVYVVGYQIASIVPMVSLAIVNAHVARLFRLSDPAQRRRRFGEDLPISMAVICGIAATVALFAPEILSLVTSAEYEAARGIARIVSLGLICHGVFQLVLLGLYYERRLMLISAISGVSLGANIVLNIALLPRLGIEGAAWATVGSFALAAVLALAALGRDYINGVAVRSLGPALLGLAVTVAAIDLPVDASWGWSFVLRGVASLALCAVVARQIGAFRSESVARGSTP